MDDPRPPSETPNERITPAETERDRVLVRRAQEGDSTAFDQLVEHHKTRVLGMLYHMLSDRSAAADLAQEAFVKAFRSLAGFRNESHFFSWLYRIVINLALNHLKARREPAISLDGLNEWANGVEETQAYRELVARESVHKDLDLGELRERLNESLQKLSKSHRAVVVLHDLEGLSHTEIAKILGCSEATSRSRLFYAHQLLQTWLADYLSP
ncbi:MAG: sigma-70 family RNA polymerase sigma factor [Verrucomicrobiae bacterium]|nr:sigma-70 family RNA polymerase sigma factor [Verrucomicrobiae bacterium]